MARLSGETRTFKARDRAVNKTYENQLKHCQAPESLELKVGAQVILLKNVDPDKGLVNGSRGVVVGFKTHPKSSNDLPREFKKVELPVVKFEAINAVGSKPSKKDEDDEDSDDDVRIVEEEEEEEGKLIEPGEWTNKVGDSTVSSRIQIPLRLAWALSVHKSQGMTIPNLAVSLSSVFEYGQAYVALSRATELRLLTLRGFSPGAFRAHPKVKHFYRLLEGKGGAEGTTGSTAASATSCSDSKSGGGGVHHSTYSSYLSSQAGTGNATARGGSGGGFSGVSPRGDQAKPAGPPLTDEQRRRMEENRRRALELRRKKQAQESSQSQSRSLAPGRDTTGNAAAF
eukprot:CAMPEP_0113576188 /NCGR_PEP_ID=MMETSP0015_2-20120614/28144_1 /TAXON_ID=2838 /ORGANISM="Odontella" /LENGTH=341 /DNA_ID=CAMNT_0000479569 /DNA_START=6 /DNA_END=1028 /DNA_ORIENTATION=+ /assembly_acc=CAM_ASM_000160